LSDDVSSSKSHEKRPASAFQQEIAEQPEALARLLLEGREAVDDCAERVRRFDPEWVVIAARGTSDNAARYAQYLLGAQNRLGVGLAIPSLFTLYEKPPRLDRALTIGISQSGQSPDVVSVVEETRRQGGATLCITNDTASPLASAAESCIPILAGLERSVAATKTYSNQLMALAMLSTALSSDQKRWEELQQVPSAVGQALQMNSNQRVSTLFLEASKFLILGRGYNYSTAFEIALKIKETSYVLAEPYSIADLLHGPMAMIEADLPIMIVAPSGRAAEAAPEYLTQLKQRGARMIVLSDCSDLLELAESTLPLPQGIPEWLSPMVAIAPGQLWAKALAEAKGLDPDAPRGLSKITLTR
jgi:glucosamine--fructose-6-phosphate aminotransferase (isomerizing)